MDQAELERDACLGGLPALPLRRARRTVTVSGAKTTARRLDSVFSGHARSWPSAPCWSCGKCRRLLHPRAGHPQAGACSAACTALPRRPFRAAARFAACRPVPGAEACGEFRPALFEPLPQLGALCRDTRPRYVPWAMWRRSSRWVSFSPASRPGSLPSLRNVCSQRRYPAIAITPPASCSQMMDASPKTSF